MDEAQKTKLMADCPCGAKKEDGTPMKYGEHCGKDEMCFCGSGKAAKDCCMQTPEAHAAM